MKRAAISIAVLCLFVGTFTKVATSQKKPPNVAGMWESITRMPDKTLTEQWTITQMGDKITCTVKGAGGDLMGVGTIDDVGFFRVDFMNGTTLIKVRATLDDNALDGSTTIGKDEHLWSAKRKK
jgi:hypothetical protein